MKSLVDEGGKGSQGFIEVIMDEIDDIKIDLAKKVINIVCYESQYVFNVVTFDNSNADTSKSR